HVVFARLVKNVRFAKKRSNCFGIPKLAQVHCPNHPMCHHSSCPATLSTSRAGYSQAVSWARPVPIGKSRHAFSEKTTQIISQALRITEITLLILKAADCGLMFLKVVCLLITELSVLVLQGLDQELLGTDLQGQGTSRLGVSTLSPSESLWQSFFDEDSTWQKARPCSPLLGIRIGLPIAGRYLHSWPLAAPRCFSSWLSRNDG
ncbi:unnamed protein product, partial [Cladocopium goreaui]